MVCLPKASIALQIGCLFSEFSRIRETKHLSTDADNSTDAIGGWSKNTQKPDNPSGSVVSTMFCDAKSAKKNTFFLCGDVRPLPNKNVQMLDHFFILLFPKHSESLKILDIQLWEVGAKRRSNGTSKVNRQTDRRTDGQTDRQTDRRTFRLIESNGPEGRCFEKYVPVSSAEFSFI